MKAINSRDSFLVSGLIHIMIGGVIILMLKQDYKVVKEIDISFLFNSVENQIQNQEVKSKTIQSPHKLMNKHISTISSGVSRSAVTKTLYPSDSSEITASLPIEMAVSTNTVIVASINNPLPEKEADSVSRATGEKSFDSVPGEKAYLKGDAMSRVTGEKSYDSGLKTGSNEGIDASKILESLTGRIEAIKRYPYIARKKGIEGTVLLKIVLSEKGELIHVFIKVSSGYEILDKDAVSLVQRACSNYRIKTGRALEIELPIKYSLDNL